MAAIYQTKRVVDYYHNGKRVLYKYHKIGNESKLVYSAYAYGGYIKQGLLLQLDCSHNLVAGGTWTSMVGSASATINGDYTDGGVNGITLTSITLPDVEAAYWEVAKVENYEVVTKTYTSKPTISGTIYEVRAYASNIGQFDHNKARDLANFAKVYPTDKYCYIDIDDVYRETSTNTIYSGNAKVLLSVPSGLTSLANLAYSGSTSVNNTNLNIVLSTNIDVSQSTLLSQMYRNCASLTSVGDLSGWDVSKVTSTNNMFSNCASLTSVGDLSGWDVSKVASMSGMFNNCASLTSVGDLSGWDVSKVTTMASMIFKCSGLTSVGDLSGWDVSKVTSMSGMFSNCTSLTSVGDLSGWDVSQVTSMRSMFYNCTSLTSLGLPKLISNVDVMYMFNNCASLTTILGCGTISTSLSLSNCPLTPDSIGKLLNALDRDVVDETLTLKSGLINRTDNPDLYDIIDELIENTGWEITGV